MAPMIIICLVVFTLWILYALLVEANSDAPVMADYRRPSRHHGRGHRFARIAGQSLGHIAHHRVHDHGDDAELHAPYEVAHVAIELDPSGNDTSDSAHDISDDMICEADDGIDLDMGGDTSSICDFSADDDADGGCDLDFGSDD